MNYRKLGRTEIDVSEVAFGAWGIGGNQWRGGEDDESVRALERAIDLGINLVDTALAYGDGHSESLVGAVTNAREESVYVATKVPPMGDRWATAGISVDEVFPGHHIRASVEQSLRNLGRDHIDILQLHAWEDAWIGSGDWRETITALKSEGKIRFFGVSTNDHEPENVVRLIESRHVDSVQVVYNIFDQSPQDRLFDVCRGHNVGVIARVPFDEGGLTGRITPDTTFPDGDFRNDYFGGARRRQVYERVAAICRDLDVDRDRLPVIALRFVLSHPAVSTVVTGMRSVRHVEQNCEAGAQGSLPGDLLERLAAHRWMRNFYG